MQNIYVVRGSEQAGPFTEAEIRAQLASGAITGDTLVWWDGLPEWTPLSQSPLAAPAAAEVPSHAPAPIPGAPAPVTAIPAMAGVGRTSTLAIVSLILSVVGLTSICCWFLLIFPIGGVICGYMARAEIAKDPSIRGGGLALAGMIIGIVSIVLSIVLLVIGLMVGHASTNLKEMFDTIQSQMNAAAAAATNTPPATNNAPATPGQ